jgi:hypothetical protein
MNFLRKIDEFAKRICFGFLQGIGFMTALELLLGHNQPYGYIFGAIVMWMVVSSFRTGR